MVIIALNHFEFAVPNFEDWRRQNRIIFNWSLQALNLWILMKTALSHFKFVFTNFESSKNDEDCFESLWICLYELWIFENWRRLLWFTLNLSLRTLNLWKLTKIALSYFQVPFKNFGCFDFSNFGCLGISWTLKYFVCCGTYPLRIDVIALKLWMGEKFSESLFFCFLKGWGV